MGWGVEMAPGVCGGVSGVRFAFLEDRAASMAGESMMGVVTGRLVLRRRTFILGSIGIL